MKWKHTDDPKKVYYLSREKSVSKGLAFTGLWSLHESRKPCTTGEKGQPWRLLGTSIVLGHVINTYAAICKQNLVSVRLYRCVYVSHCIVHTVRCPNNWPSLCETTDILKLDVKSVGFLVVMRSVKLAYRV